MAHNYSFHLFHKREFAQRFLPAAQGNEPLVREILDAAGAEGPRWTALHKLFDGLRAPIPGTSGEDAPTELVLRDGPYAQQTLVAAFAQLTVHLRAAFVSEGFGLSSIDSAEFPELAALIRSPGELLAGPDGRSLEGIPSHLPGQVPVRCLPGRSSGGYIRKEDVRPFLKAFRAAMPKLAKWAQDHDLPAEHGITLLLSALVQAKLGEYSLIEGCEVLGEPKFIPKGHVLKFGGELPPAVVREVGKLFGRVPAPKAAPAPAPAPAPKEAVPYSPKGVYGVGQLLVHKSFGTGEVIKVLDSKRLVAKFGETERNLAQGFVPAALDDDEEDGSV
ncbi:hypothetical protein OAX78_01755 [Planctomycetota bacterium]|nr:hypothetical protein [Planctomycetota bacterium]